MDNKDKRSPALKKAQAAYENKRTVKRVSFNNDTDAELLRAANDLPNFSDWVKSQILNNLIKK